MKIPKNKRNALFGGTFILANKMQLVADKMVNGLSTKQWFLLRNLLDLPSNPPPTITMLAKETDTSRQNVSKMLEILQKQGYVRLCGHPDDRRSQAVVLTEDGTSILRQVADEATPFFEQLFAGIDENDWQIAAEVVIKLIANLQKMQQETEDPPF